MTSTGWTWNDCLDQLTTSRIKALHKAWLAAPPVHRLFAAFVGYKTPEQTKAQHMTPEMADAVIRGGGVLISADMLGGMAMAGRPPGR